jgi:hypothetical protein
LKAMGRLGAICITLSVTHNKSPAGRGGALVN